MCMLSLYTAGGYISVRLLAKPGGRAGGRHGPQASTVKVGIIYSRSGLLASYGAMYEEGLRLGMQYLTHGTNTVNGHKIVFTFNDDAGRDAHLNGPIASALMAKAGELLSEPPEYLETAKVFDMLLAVPKYGRVKANKILVNCRIAPSKTIGGLSERQRRELISLLNR